MIEIKADSERNENVTEATVIVNIDADGKRAATKELYAILKSLDEKCPDIFMSAIDMHIKHMIIDEMKEGGDDDYRSAD